MNLSWLIWVALGYLSGSIPFGLLIGKLCGVDVRKAGSGNIGATNVGRVLGRKMGGLCFALDVLKGLTPVLAAGAAMHFLGQRHLDAADAWRWLAVGLAAVLGHVFPVWLKFKGGKGVATALGVLLGFWPVLTLPGVAALLIWIALVAVFRYVSLASMAAGVALPVLVAVEGFITHTGFDRLVPFMVITGLLALLVVLRHRTNISRLLAGTENKVGAKKPPEDGKAHP